MDGGWTALTSQRPMTALRDSVEATLSSNMSRHSIGRLAIFIVIAVFGHVAMLFAEDAQPLIKVNIEARDGSYSIRNIDSIAPVLQAGIAVHLDDRWLRSSDYPRHSVKLSIVQGLLGDAQEWTVLFSGLPHQPDLSYRLRAYLTKPFAELQVFVENSTAAPIRVTTIRPIDASGESTIDLGGPVRQDRFLSDSFSENIPDIQILGPGTTNHVFRGVGSQLVYNQQTHQSFFVGALTSDRFLTILRLHICANDKGAKISKYEVDSTGTTELVNNFANVSPSQQTPLVLPIGPGKELASEKLLLGVGEDYHRQLETYGSLIRQLHHARVRAASPMGWWSWTAYYYGLTEGAALTNAQWLSENLKTLGFDFFHIDEGYQYARGEYITPNATLFPHGLADLERKIIHLGLIPGIWTAPFQVSERSWVYDKHRDWLVHDAKGEPISIGSMSPGGERLFVLDCTNPGAQGYLWKTYDTLVRVWGIHYIKLDFMDGTAIEGHYYRPNTTAMEAQRIGLGIIRKAVGDETLLDKDGSVMLNPVGYVDFGRISEDTAHIYSVIKAGASGIAARYYMNRNFFVNDPDAFNISTQTKIFDDHGRINRQPLTLDEAEMSIALAAVAGGMFEIGDDLPRLSSDPTRLGLVENKDLIDMVRLGKAATPLDLMTFLPDDEQPSIFYLKESHRQSILTVFNWSDNPRSHTIDLPALGLDRSGRYIITSVFANNTHIFEKGGCLILKQPPHSVRMLKIVDDSIVAEAPRIKLNHPQVSNSGDTVVFEATTETPTVPVLSYHWDFGDGVSLAGARVSHTYTEPGSYSVGLTAVGLDGLSAEDKFHITVTGSMSTAFRPAESRRYCNPSTEPPQQ